MLPTLPLVRDRVAKIMENPQSSIKDVSAAIAVDPIMTARLLQAVDWRRSIFNDKVPTVSRAVTVMGFEAVRRVVVSQEVFTASDLSAAGAPFPLRDLWLHAVGAAIAGRTLATHIGYPEPDECYIAGLLHDIGKLILWRLFPERFTSLIEEARRLRSTFYGCEVESGAASHAVIGRMLVEQWDLPPRIVESVGLHHTPNLAEAHTKIVAVTHAADILAHALGYGFGGDPFVPPPKPAGIAALGLRATQIEAVMLEIEREYPKAAALVR